LRPAAISGSEKRHQLEGIYEDLRGLAGELEVAVITASQTNRQAVNAEIITMEAISEAFNKCFVADFIMTLSRTIKDRNANTGRVFIAKNRNGADGLIYNIFMDTSNVSIKVIESSGSMKEFQERSLNDAKKSLKEKYNNHKNTISGSIA
jgi:replicative DNA helicase